MERLEPVLKQKFWILLGVGMVMTITGWWLATGSLANTTKARNELVEAAYKSIPTDEIPNRDWSAKLSTLNAEQNRAVKHTAAWLWDQQKSRMTWPDSVAPFAWQNGYRGEIPLTGRESYRTAYGVDVRRVWDSVRPFRAVDGTGIVVFGQSHNVLPQRTWGSLAPSSAEMWDAQEDLWLIESLLRTILDVNGGPDAGRVDAFVHAIETLKLVGGQPPAQRKGAGGSAGPGAPGASGTMGSGAGAHGGGGPQAPSSTFGGEMMGGGARSGAPQGVTTSEFEPKEEFGDDGAGRGGTGGMGLTTGGPTAGPTAAHSGSTAGPTAGSGAAGSGAMGPGAAANTMRRYIEDDAVLPYKSRGFYMTVVMDHRKIPGLIAELSANGKSPWPVEIVRVQMVRLHDNDIDTRGGSGIGGSGGTPNLQSLLSGVGGSGGGSTGGTGLLSGSRPPGASGFESSSAGSEGAGNPAAVSQASAAMAALENALQDPFMARVSICGVITLYKEVKPDAVPAAGNPPGTPAAPAQPAAAQPGVAPGVPPASGQPNPVAPATTNQTGSTIPVPAASGAAVPAAPAGTSGTPTSAGDAKPTTPAATGSGASAPAAPVDVPTVRLPSGVFTGSGASAPAAPVDPKAPNSDTR